jgi:DNA invertase Pin-like site-specific DNA recombinase
MTVTTVRYVVYYRVSDVKQGRSGLGLEAQRGMFATFLLGRPGRVVGEYTEVETGKSLKKSLRRPELRKAMDHARSAKATLVIAKIDRLARNVAFISALMESGQPFVCCDMPEADNFTIHILAALAEREGQMISERTSAALRALKERGVLLGSARPGHWEGHTPAGELRTECRRKGLEKARISSQITVKEEMSRQYEPLVPWIRDLREAGTTLQGIVDTLNAKGCRTRRSEPWNVSTLRRVILKFLGREYLGQITSKLNPCVAVGA